MKRCLFVLLFCLFVFSSLKTYAVDTFGYSEEHPLVIVSDWDFRPFEFLDVEGHPAGYNVEVFNLILDKLQIPHKFVMQEWHVATDMFKKHEADLIHALFYFYEDRPYVSTHKFINYYNLKVARRADVPPLTHIRQLQENDTVLLKKDDYAALALHAMSDLPFVMDYHSPKDGLTGIRRGKYKYYIWGELPLNRKIQELGLDSLVLDDIDIPAGELRIIGYNKDLIDIIDDQYTRLEQAGELQKIYDRWFHPERVHDDASPVALFILGGLLLAAVIVLLLMRLVTRRVRNAVRESSDLGQMMDQVLNMGDYFVVEWDLHSNMLRNKYGHMLPNGDMKPEEFLQRMHPDEAKQLHTLNAQAATGVITHFDMRLSFNQGTENEPLWKEFYGNAIVETENDKPRYIVYTTKDITVEVNEDRHVQTVTNKYKKMFDTNLLPISFYDANGRLLALNRKMCELCQLNSENEQFFRNTTLFEFSNIKGIYLPGSQETMHVCQHFYEPQLGLDKYVELRIQPVMDDDDNLVYYIATNRDITAERNMYLEQREHDRQLHAANEAIHRYEQQLQYLLEESKMYIWSFRPSENLVRMTRSPGQVEFHESMEDYLQSVNAEVRQQAQIEIAKALQQAKPYNVILPFDHTPLDQEPTWYSVIGMPIFNKDGQLTEYFGLSRNITNLMQAQEQLRVETARAEDSGRLKSAFLANMTHEIRTPLNAIVGFSSLLKMVDTEEERMEFIRIIRNNCDMLLRLINDILEASNMGQTIALKLEHVDLPEVFNDICQTLQQRVQEPGVEFQKDNPYDHYPADIDKGRLQQLLTNFVTNAVKYTHEGHIRVGWRSMSNNELTSDTPKPKAIPGLYFYCEDTGAGIPKEKQALVFERFVKLNDFVQGTGLGLSICKAIIEKFGGEIGVDSEEGKGSTFWFWIPAAVEE